MSMKTTLVLVAAILLGAWPASASSNDDTVSRTFPYVQGAFVPLGNIGWYGVPPVHCGVPEIQEPNVPGVFYYDWLRIHYNLPGFLAPRTAGTSLSVLMPCPAFLTPPCAPLCALHLEPVTVAALARTVASQDASVCDQTANAFFECIVTDSRWWVDHCPWANAHFSGRNSQENKGVLKDLNAENLAFSSDIDCVSYKGLGYDYSFLLGSGGSSSEGRGFPVAQVVPYNNGRDETGFVVSCFEATFTTVDYSTAFPTITFGWVHDGVDWFQVLDLDAIGLGTVGTNWVGDVVTQLGMGPQGNMAAGLPDLGGDNDCDFPLRGPPPQCFDGVDNDTDSHQDIEDNSPLPTSQAPPNTGTGGCWHLACPTNGACYEYYDPSDTSESP